MISSLDLDLNIADRRARGLLRLVGSKVMAGSNGQKPLLIRNSAGPVTIRAWVPSNNGDREFDNVDLATATVRRALGPNPPDRVPATGTLPIAPLSTPVISGLLVTGKRYYIKTFVAGDSFTNVGATSNASGVLFTATGTTPTTWTNASALQEVTADLSVAATAAEVQTALNATAAVAALGGVTVTKPGAGSYEVLFTNLGAQQAMEGPVNWNMDAGSVVSVSRIVLGSSTKREIQLIRLLVNPYCYGEFTTALPAADYDISTIQGATADLPATKRLTLDPQPYDGHLVITLDDNDPFEVPFDASAAQIESLAGPLYTVSRKAENAWDISGVDAAQDVNITADVSKLVVPLGVTGEMPLNTVALHRAFAATTAKTITLLDQVDITFPGELPLKVYQAEIEIARDALDLSAIVPTPIPASDFATLAGLIGGKEPAHANLAAIRALVTNAFGLGLLTKADGLAILNYISGQPLNDGLTAIGALVTAGFGRSLLTAANSAAARLLLALDQINNTSDANKPISTLQAAALALKAPLASPGFTGIPTVPTAASAISDTQAASTAFVHTLIKDLSEINVAQKEYKASPAATAAFNTLAIQAAINDAHDQGRGVVRVTVPGEYQLTGTLEPDLVYVDTATPEQAVRAHLVLRSGVFLRLDPGVVLVGTDTTKHMISLIDMDGGGVIGGGHVKGAWDPEAQEGAGHGIFLHITEPLQDNINVRIDDIEISHVASYGLGAQFGDYHNNRYSNLYIHDVGADAIDHKVHLGSTNKSRGVVFNNIMVQRYGLRTGRNDNAGLDLRGPAQIHGFWALDYAKAGKANVGIRFSPGIMDTTAGGVREPSSYSSLTGFYIDSGDPSVADAYGIIVHSAESVTIAQGIVKNCQTGAVSVSYTSDGFPHHSSNTRVIGVTVEGTWLTAFFTNSSYVTFLACAAAGAIDTFEEERDNLVNGQTVFVSPRQFDPAKVQVYKNGVLQTLTTHYTLGGDNKTITLVNPVVLTDIIEIITPTALGFSLDGEYNIISSCSAQNVTLPYNVVAGEGTHQIIANQFGAAYGSVLNALSIGHEESPGGPGKLWIGVHAAGETTPNGELILGKATNLITDEVLGQLSFYSGDSTANATGRQAAIKAISSHSTGLAAVLAFFAGTGAEDSFVEAMRIGHDRGVNIGGTDLVGPGNLKVIGLIINDTAAARTILLGTTNGTTIGSSGAKMAFYGAAPIVKPTGSLLTALTNLGLVGSPSLAFADIASKPTTLVGYGINDAQPLDSDLTAIAALSTSSFGRDFLALADAAAAYTKLALGTMATQNAAAIAITGGTLDGLTRIDFASVLGEKIILYGTIGAANYGLAVESNQFQFRTTNDAADFVFGHSTGGVFTETARITGEGHGEFVDIDGRQLLLDATNTPAGTTGAQTIDKAAGTVNMAAGGTSLVVTNARCTSNSLVFAVVRTNDSTAIIKNVVPASGSFTIRLNASATAETSIGFHVINR